MWRLCGPPGFAAISWDLGGPLLNGNPGRVRFALRPATRPLLPLASLGLAKPSRALASAGKARLRLRDHGSPTSTPRDYGESLRDLQAKILATASSHSDGC